MNEEVEPVPWHFTITRSGGEKSHTLTIIIRGSSVYLYEGVLAEKELSDWSSQIRGPASWTDDEFLNWQTRLAAGPRRIASMKSTDREPNGNAGLKSVVNALKPLLTASFGETVRVDLPPKRDLVEDFDIEATILGYAVRFPLGPDFSDHDAGVGRSANERNPLSLSDLNTLPRNFEITHDQEVLRVLGVKSKKSGLEVTPIVCGTSNSGELDLRIAIDPTRSPPRISAARSSRLVFLTTPDGEPIDYVDEVGGEYLALLSDELVATGWGSYDADDPYPPLGGLELTNVEIFEGQTVEVVARFLQKNFPTWALLKGIRPESDNLSWNQAKVLDSFLTALRRDFDFISFELSGTDWGLYPNEVWQSPDFAQEESLFPKIIIDGALQHLSSSFPDLKYLNEFLSDKDYRWSSDAQNKLMTIARTYTNQKTSSGEPNPGMLRDCLEELLSLAGRRQD
jgi:hypothetical protein